MSINPIVNYSQGEISKESQTMHFGTPRLLIAGGYYGVNTIVQSISVEKLKQLQAKIKQTQETLQNSNQTQLNSLTREDIMGDMVYAASLSYYAQMIAQGKMAVKALDTHYELVGSSGIIGYKPQVEKLFGLPVRLTAGGMNCDLIDTEMTEQSNNDQKKHVQANQQLGIIGSSLEHQVLEQLFAQNGEQAFSAVKAIQLANEQGQKIYTITKENYQEVLPKLQLATHAIADIRAAAQAGLTITTHEKRISINGYTGEGYIILNERGGGAYLINGGLYGAIIVLGISGFLFAAIAPLAGASVIGTIAAFSIGVLFMSAAAGLAGGNKEWCYASLLAAIWIFNKFFIERFFKLPGVSTPKYMGFTGMLSMIGILPAMFGTPWKICSCGVEPRCFNVPEIDPWDYLK